MYFCPNCKKKFRQYRRRCPICNGPCYRKDGRAILLIVTVGVLFLLLVGMVLFLRNPGNFAGTTGTNDSSTFPSGTQDSSAPSESTTPSDSEPTEPSDSESTIPPASSPPSTTLPTPSTSPVTGLYTREQLEAMDSTFSESGFGAGRSYYPDRPAIPVAEQKKYSQYDAHFIAEDTNTVYLTFDCGYEYYATDKASGKQYPVTGKILDVLKEKNVKAVFFITLEYAKKQPELVQRMIDEGHTVGNHSATHPVMPAQTIDRMEEEVMSLHNYVLENFGYKMTLFRPPTGAYSIQSLAVLQNLGYKSILWSFQYYDYDTANQPTTKAAFDRITGSAHNGAIYLLHAISEANASALGDAIDHLRAEKGYTIELFA